MILATLFIAATLADTPEEGDVPSKSRYRGPRLIPKYQRDNNTALKDSLVLSIKEAQTKMTPIDILVHKPDLAFPVRPTFLPNSTDAHVTINITNPLLPQRESGSVVLFDPFDILRDDFEAGLVFTDNLTAQPANLYHPNRNRRNIHVTYEDPFIRIDESDSVIYDEIIDLTKFAPHHSESDDESDSLLDAKLDKDPGENSN